MAQLLKGLSEGIEKILFGNIPAAGEDPHGSLTSIGLLWRIIIGWATLPKSIEENADDKKIKYDTSNFHPVAAVTATATLSLATIVLGEYGAKFIPHGVRSQVKIITYALALMPLYHVIGLSVDSSRKLINGQELPPPAGRCS